MGFMKSSTLLLLLFFVTSEIDGQPDANFFRKDYTFLADARAFYKVHTIHKSWQDAKKKCEREGATLFYPQDKEEADLVINFWNDTQPNFHWIYVGASSLLAKGVFVTVEGNRLDEVYNNWSPGEPNDANGEEDCVVLLRQGTLNDDKCEKKWPFICKKTLDSLEWNTLCHMPDNSYIYNENLERCYKFHLTPLNWTEAYTVCSAEQSYLAIINTKPEADYLVKMTADAPKDVVRGDYLRGAVHLGFHNKGNAGWETIQGTPLTESGYTNWGTNQPDGGINEQCGSMFYNGNLNDIGCSQKMFFICEHEIGILNSSINERFAELFDDIESLPKNVTKAR